MTRRRLDGELVRRGLAATRSEARDAILGGKVTVGGRPALKPGGLVGISEPLVLSGPARRFASRGGDKLAGALQAFELDPRGAMALDAGAGTGGFTDALLVRGAEHVVAIDVGYGQLAWRLRGDPRVTVKERFNVRNLSSADLPYRPDLVVADLSFISLASVVPVLAEVAAPDATFCLLVKPQFEAGRGDVGRGGVVTDAGAWRRSIEAVAGAARASGLGPRGVTASPLTGPAGNVEFFLLAAGGADPQPLDIDAAIAGAPSAARTG